MAEVVGAVSAASDGEPDSQAVDAPAGVADGDLLFAFSSTDFGNYSGMTAPAGWDLVTGHDSGGGQIHGKIWSKVADSEPSSYTFECDGNEGAVLTILALRGVTLDGLVSATDTSGSGQTRVAPSLTGTTADAGVLVCYAMSDGTGGSLTWTPPAGMTEQGEGQVSGQWTTHSVATLLDPPAPTEARTFTESSFISANGIQASIWLPDGGVEPPPQTGSGTVHLTATAGLGTTATRAAASSISLTADADMGRSAAHDADTAISLPATARLDRTATRATVGTASLPATARLDPSSTRHGAGTGDLAAVARLDASATRAAAATATLDAAAGLDATGIAFIPGSGSATITLNTRAGLTATPTRTGATRADLLTVAGGLNPVGAHHSGGTIHLGAVGELDSGPATPARDITVTASLALAWSVGAMTPNPLTAGPATGNAMKAGPPSRSTGWSAGPAYFQQED